MEKLIFKWRREVVEVELMDGKVAEFTLQELPIPEADKLFEMILTKSMELFLTRGGDSENLNKSLESYDYKADVVTYLQNDTEFWRVVLQQEDVDWINKVAPSHQLEIIFAFIHLNPYLAQKKRDLDATPRALLQLLNSPTNT